MLSVCGETASRLALAGPAYEVPTSVCLSESREEAHYTFRIED